MNAILKFVEGSPTKVVVNETFDKEMSNWNTHVEAKWRACVNLGLYNFASARRGKEEAHEDSAAKGSLTSTTIPRCMPVFYELLVQEPEKWMRLVYDYIGLPFNPDVLHHQNFIKKRIRLSRSAILIINLQSSLNNCS